MEIHDTSLCILGLFGYFHTCPVIHSFIAFDVSLPSTTKTILEIFYKELCHQDIAKRKFSKSTLTFKCLLCVIVQTVLSISMTSACNCLEESEQDQSYEMEKNE